jgi:hypothetical protein
MLLSPPTSTGRAITAISSAFGSLPPPSLGWGCDRPNPSLHASLASHPSKEPRLGLAEHDKFRVVLGHAQEIEDCFFRLDQ